MNKVVKIEELSLEDLRKYHERKMLEMFNLVQSLLSKAQQERIVGSSVIWIESIEFVRLYTSIEELTEKIRLLEKENSSLKDKRLIENAVLDSRAMQISETIAEELTELRDKVTVLNDTLLLFEYRDVVGKRIDTIIDIAFKLGLEISGDSNDNDTTTLLKAWDKGGVVAVRECVKGMIKDRSNLDEK